MNKLTKVVNIYPSMPITGVNPPIRSVVKKVTKSIEEIRTCLMARAIVEEVLADGRTVKLNMSNYDQGLTEGYVTEQPHVVKCACVECAPVVNTSSSEAKSEWQAEYDKFLAGKNLAMMTRKQRRALETAARAAADAAVSKNEAPNVVMGVASIETVEEPVVEEEVVAEEPVVETVEEEAIVETLDVETELVDNSTDEEEVTEETTESVEAEEVVSADAE